MKAGRIMLVAAIQIILCSPSHKVAAAGAANGAGMVKGIVKLEGSALRPKPINMAADPSCAKLHSTPVLTQDVVADANGRLENVVIFIADGLADSVAPPPRAPVVIAQKGCMYQPHIITMMANQTLEVINEDPTTHNIHPQPANNREWNKAEPPNTKVEESFPREEIAIPVKCNVHPWMKAYVAVFKHPYFVLTGKDGSFDLTNVPPGTYTLKAWHEKLGTASQQITIGANETKTVQFTFKPKAGS
jgi:plastocyanin